MLLVNLEVLPASSVNRQWAAHAQIEAAMGKGMGPETPIHLRFEEHILAEASGKHCCIACHVFQPGALSDVMPPALRMNESN